MRSLKKLLVSILAFAMTATLFTGCFGTDGGGSSQPRQIVTLPTSEATETPTQATEPTEPSTEELPAVEFIPPWKDEGLFGSPWVNSTVSGNLTSVQPSAADDLYLHFNYDYIKQHQDENSVAMTDNNDELRTFLEEYLADASHDDAELRQLRIFYEQALDDGAKAERGLQDLRPFIHLVYNAGSIAELNRALTMDTFPFDPFLDPQVGADDMTGVNTVTIFPNLLYVDNYSGPEYYQDTTDMELAQARFVIAMTEGLFVASDLRWIIEKEADAQTLMQQLYLFEKAYAQYCDYGNRYMYEPYGSTAGSIDSYTLDELQELSGAFPVKDTLIRFGKDASPEFFVARPEWLTELGKLWTDENLDAIKFLILAKMLRECEPMLDPVYLDELLVSLEDPAEPGQHAYDACNTVETFDHLIARLYVENVIGSKGRERMDALARDLIASYRTLIDSTPWLGAESKKAIEDKFDAMRMNILVPETGYIDYSGLQLVTAEEGGTLIGNYFRLKEYRNDLENALIGKPAISTPVWNMYEPTVANAFYDIDSNSINLYPGLVTSEKYREGISEEELLGGIGCVIGHELSHAFDFFGSQYDGNGKEKTIFSDADLTAFLNRIYRLNSYYDGIEIFAGKYPDSTKQSGEAASDLCGVQVALTYASGIAGFDYEAFFEELALTYGEVMDSYTAGVFALLDEHPVSHLRVNVNVQMFDEFYNTFGVVPGNGMYLLPKDRIVIWGPDAG